MSKPYHIALLFVILIGFWIRLEYLNRPMHLDESVTVIAYASGDLPSVVANYTAPNNHIFHTIFVHFVYHFLGKLPVLIRLPAFIFGVLLIPATYTVGSRFYNWRVGLLAATFVATNPTLIVFSVNARGYTLQALIVLVLLWLAHKLKTEDDTRQWLLFGVLAALGFYTVPTMIYAMGFIALWLLLNIFLQNTGEQRTTLLKNAITALIFGAVLTIVLYSSPLYFSGLTGIRANVQPMPLADYIRLLPITLWQFITEGLLEYTPLLFAVGCTLLFVLGSFRDRKLAKDKLTLILPAIIWFVLLLIIQHGYIPPRVWIFFIPIYFIFVSVGIMNLLPSKIPPYSYVAGVILICTVFALYVRVTDTVRASRELGYAPDAERAALYLDEILQPGDTYMLVYPSSYTIFYYADVHNLTFEQRVLEEPAADSRESNAYVYYHYGSEMDEVHRLFPGVLDNVSVVQDFPSSVLVRVQPSQ